MPSPYYRSRPADYSGIEEGLGSIAKMFAPQSMQDQYLAMKALDLKDERERKAAGITGIEQQYPLAAQFVRAGIANPVQEALMADMASKAAAGVPIEQLDPYNIAKGMSYGSTIAGTREAEAAATRRALIKEQGDLTRTLSSPMGAGTVRQLPPSVATQFGLPQMQVGAMEVGQGQRMVLPDNRVIEGAPKPESEDQVKAAILRGMTPLQQQAVVFGNTPLETILGERGTPALATRPAAIGQEPVLKDDKPTVANYETPDKKTGTARLQAGKWVDSQTGVELPQGSRTYSASLQGGTSETGLGSPAKNNVEQRLLDAAQLKSTADQLRTLVKNNPMSQGIGGKVRGSLQDIVATTQEGANLWNQLNKQTQIDIRNGMVDPELVAKFQSYDPSIPQAQMLELLLAGQLAKVLDPNGRISNDRMKQVMTSLGAGGWTSNAQRTNATLDVIDSIVKNQRDMLGSFSPTAAAVGTGSAPASATPGSVTAPPVVRTWNPVTGRLE